MSKLSNIQEYAEAEQESVNQRNNVFRALLSPEEEAKFKAVEEALDILTKAKVPCYMFPQMKFTDPKTKKSKDVIYQYNNLVKLHGWENGKLNSETKIKLVYYNTGLIYAFINLIASFGTPSKDETFEEFWTSIFKFLQMKYYEFQAWYDERELPKEVKKILDEQE